MSHDGSSAKSYIRHTTEKERLDNLAFASFPEDYLPYAAPGHHRGSSAPPPYLLWGDDRRRRTPRAKRKRNPRCAGALLCAIGLVVLAILAVVAISVYLGVVTNLFRSPVISVSGRFLSSDDFSEELLNSTSTQFLKKAEFFQSQVEKAFLSSSLEPAFIAARIYSFRPGMVVFFRVYLDRRKLVPRDGDSPPTDLVRNLVAQRLAVDPESVHVEENDELVAEPHITEKMPEKPLSSTTLKPSTQQPSRPRPAAGGVGEWRPVPIEDSVSPSFMDRPPGGVGNVRSPEEFSRRNPASSPAPSPAPEKIPQRNSPVAVVNPQEGIGSVRILEESRVRNPPLKSNRREGTGSVRVLEESAAIDPVNLPEGVGSVRLLEDTSQRDTKLPGNPADGFGTVRLLDELPKNIPPQTEVSRAGVGLVRVLEDKPSKKPQRYPADVVKGMETPPTLAPSVSLVVRNRSRSDRLKNFGTRLEKGQQVGVGSIREIITETDSFPLLPQSERVGIPSKLLNVVLNDHIESIKFANETVYKNITGKETHNSTVKVTPAVEDERELVLLSNSGDLKLLNRNSTENKTVETETVFLVSEEVITEKSEQRDTGTSSLENIIFNYTHNPTITTINSVINITLVSPTEAAISNYREENDMEHISTDTPSTIVLATNESFKDESLTLTTEVSDQDSVHSSIVNHSQYPNPEPHYHTIEKEHNISKEPYEAHTLEGHGFHQPLNNTLTGISPASDISTTELSTKIENPVFKPIKISSVEYSIENENSESESTEVSTFELTSPFSEISTIESPTVQNFKLVSSEVSALESSHDTQNTKFISSDIPMIPSPKNSSDLEFDELLESVTPLTSDNSETSSFASLAYASVRPEDVENITTDDNSQQPKVVPQMQSDLLSNNIEDEEVSGDENEDNSFQDEILRHITTLRPQQNGSSVASDCPLGMVPCFKSEEGCGIRCDMRKDCPNNEDERGCACSELLRAMGQSQKVCDGVNDCSDGSDEADCPWCVSPDHFNCPGSRTCIPSERVCDGKDDCPGGQDEKRCVVLADSTSEVDSDEYRAEGYLVVRRQGRWGKLCLDSLARSSDRDSRTRELGKAVCTALTYKNMSSSVRTRDLTTTEDAYYRISANPVNNRSSSAALFEPSSCEEKTVLRVQCHSLECGLRPSAPPSQRRRIVGGRSAEGAGTWPWAAALYREGDFQCGAALINDRWLMSAAHCFYSSQGAHWVARLGLLRRGSELPSGGEQVRTILDIVLHPEYEDIGFINDIALLRIDTPVPYSDSLRPICLPSSPSEDASVWHGRRCAVVGWGKLYEIGHTFPDSLQEVLLPVISSEECQRRSIFLPAYRITPNMFCAGFERGGRDACLGDSGGPMACPRPADGRYVLLGVTSNGDGCGRPNRPGVYTQVAKYLDWIQEVTSQHNDFRGRTGSESSCIGGVRCRLGRCVHQTKVCDGKRDCASGEDEESC